MSSAGSADTWQNPLRDKRDKRLPRIAGPCAVVIFGVTGDLATKKLMPAIYDLANRGLLPPTFALIGFARRDWVDEDFGNIVLKAVQAHARTPFRQEVWDRLNEGIRFVQGTFDDEAGYTRLAETLAKLSADMEAFKAQYANPMYRLPMTFVEIFPVGVLVSLVSAGLLRNSRFLAARRG